MMVSNGNLTGLVERLVASGHLDAAHLRTPTGARRSISLTDLGRAEFRAMAAEHERWIAELFGDLSRREDRGRCSCGSSRKSQGVRRPGRQGRRAREPIGKSRHAAARRATGRRISCSRSTARSRRSRSTARSGRIRSPSSRYAELRDFFHACAKDEDVKAVVLTGAGGNFCSGGDVHEIIGPLVEMDDAEDADSPSRA